MSGVKRYPIRIHIATALSLLVLLVGGSITWVAYQRTTSMLTESVLELSRRAEHEASAALSHLLAPARMGVAMIAAEKMAETTGRLSERLKALPLYVSALRASPAVVAYFSADAAGNYFLVRRLLEAGDWGVFAAPPEARFVVQSFERRPGADEIEAEYIYLDEAAREIGRHRLPQKPDFDPRQRPWYRQAEAASGRILTEPYTFFSTSKQGVSIAQRAEDGVRIVGADIRLDTLGQLLSHQRMTPGSHLFMIDEHGKLLARDGDRVSTVEDAADPFLARLQALPTGALDRPALREAEIDGQAWYLDKLPLDLLEKRATVLAIAIPENEMLADARHLRGQLLFIAFALLLLALPLAVWAARRISLPLSQLVTDTEAMRHFDFSQRIETGSMVLEVDELAATLRTTKSTLGHFLDILGRLSSEKDFKRLLPELLASTVEVAQVEGGLLMLVDGDALRPAAGRWRGKALDLPADARVDDDGFAGQTCLRDKRSIGGEAHAADLERFAIPARQMLSVPLFDRDRQAIGVLTLLSEAPIDPSRQCFIEALSGFAAMALETRELIALQKALFASFVEVMAGAIDAKSAYTGGHCARVPEVAVLLAEAACAESEGPYADFKLDENAWEALHLAAWLHDCGKVTTPEYVVDKATKLETLYDRIHEVRMRFEVLKRDAEIVCLRRIAEGTPESLAQADKAALLGALDDEFAFVAECNLGGEFMAPERLARLQQIAGRTWLRTLDDRLGISAEELRRKSAAPAASLPVLEPLLADKPEHRIERSDAARFGPGNPWGFTMPVPELAFERGELKNLAIARGTLGDEERYKINEHITQTIAMLCALPFPRHLVEVPEIAGSHHERIDGKGYPRGLCGDKLSPLARVMAIADVFEALTAADRPYKSAKTLSQSLSIMKKMVEEGHLDRELFRIFVRSGCAQRYAQRFLTAAQCDVVDATAFEPAIAA